MVGVHRHTQIPVREVLRHRNVSVLWPGLLNSGGRLGGSEWINAADRLFVRLFMSSRFNAVLERFDSSALTAFRWGCPRRTSMLGHSWRFCRFRIRWSIFLPVDFGARLLGQATACGRSPKSLSGKPLCTSGALQNGPLNSRSE